jgi:hypothetical protein
MALPLTMSTEIGVGIDTENFIDSMALPLTMSTATSFGI